MVDIHCHILPGMDDGAQSEEEALEMARAAVRDGIDAVIATPHHANGRYDNKAGAVTETVERMNRLLQNNGIPLTVLAGQEIRVTRGLFDDLDKGELLRLHHSPYMLLELPGDHVPEYFENWLYELQILGITPIIAHPERNAKIARNPELLYNWVREGALAQVTSHSVTGRYGMRLQKTVLEMCRRNLVHFVATDAHNTGNRPFALRDAYATIRDKIGAETADYFIDNARQIAAGIGLNDVRPPLAPKRRKFLFW
jgi:protein-tyrosine phosphatase